MAESTKRSINQHSAHIYDDPSDLTRHSSFRGIRKSATNRISHNYERLIGIAKDKKNRMCIFGVVATVVAIFSLTGAVLFSMFYARPTFCDSATEELLNAEIKQRLDNAIKHDIQRVNAPEYEFWKLLTETHLKPTFKAFRIEEQLKTKLEELRNTWLMILLAVYSLWLVLISTLASKINLVVLGSDPVGLVFLVIFGILLFVQFICMVFHRLSMLAHFLARAPYRFGHEYTSSWSYKSDEDIAAMAEAKRAEKLCRQKERSRARQRRSNVATPYDERTSLLRTEQV